MQTGQRLSAELATIGEQLEGSDGALSLLRQAARRLDRIASDHERLAEALAAVDRAVIEASEAEDKLAQGGRGTRFRSAPIGGGRSAPVRDPGRGAQAPGRTRRSAGPGGGAECATSGAPAGGGRIDLLQAEAAAARSDYLAAADALSTARSACGEAARRRSRGGAEAAQARRGPVPTVATALDEPGWGEGGRDRVEFEISTNPGAPFAPLAKIASGGELSRFILALKVALAERAAPPR
jgi:DNA repair protein RecN (Recombination protein N)